MLNDQDVDKLIKAFGENVATKDDIQGIKKDIKIDIAQEIANSESRMISVLATKEDLKEVKNDLEDLKELVQGLIISTDNIAKSIGELKLEYAAISTQLSRHEKWIKEIAEKVGLKLAMD